MRLSFMDSLTGEITQLESEVTEPSIEAVLKGLEEVYSHPELADVDLQTVGYSEAHCSIAFVVNEVIGDRTIGVISGIAWFEHL